MAEVTVAQSNWVSGELSDKMRGRFDLPIFQSGSERMLNFIPETTGAARFRSGTQFVNPTRRNQVACLLPFVFNEEQAYQLEFTQGFIRFYQSDQVITLSPKTITGVTAANPGIVTIASHGYANGDEVIINDVVGMPRMNGRNFVISNVTTNTFQLNDVLGTTPIDTSAFGAYVSGGTAVKIYEIASPYQLTDLFALKYGQNGDVMYIVHPNYEPMKLTRSGTTSWALALFVRAGDPFTTAVIISGITNASPGVVTATAHGYTSGQKIIINTVVGMTQLNNSINGTMYLVVKLSTDTFSLTDLNGNAINTTSYGVYSSAGYASDATILPGAFCFYQGRSVYGYSLTYPESIWGSKPLDDEGNPQYDDLTIGGTVADAYKFTLSPISGKVDKIQSLIPTLNFLAICTLEGISKADGGAAGTAISPVDIDITPAVTYGILQQVNPILLGITMVYIHRSALIMYSLEYDIFYNAYNAVDKNLSNEHITESGVTQMVYRNGRPPMFLYTRNDGVLIGVTFLVKENINGAHREIFGGINSKVLSVGNMPRSTNYDQTWLVVERLINGQTVRYVEYINDEVVFPERDDYFNFDYVADQATEATDDSVWRNAMFESQKQYVFCDANLTYDGSDLAKVTLTPGAVTGNGITFTAGSNVFTSDMVGRELWKKSMSGIGTGRAVITAYVSATQVTCNILSDFDTVTAMPILGWYLTTATITNLWYLEGQTVGILCDGGHVAEQIVVNGTINNQIQASVIQIGLQYLGLIRSMPLEAGGVNGPAIGKPKNINRVAIHFLNTLGAQYGSSLYDMQDVDFRLPADLTGRPSPVSTGIQRLQFTDVTEVEKHVYIVQNKPLPCTVLGVSPSCDTDNE